MKKDMEEKDPAFKVVDRRRFTETGDSVETASREKEKPKTTKAEKPKEVAEESFVRPPVTFSLFIQSLAHQTMMALGMVPWPDSGLVRLELDLAKETIDILHILKEKTANNLSKDEEHLLENLVYQLKMAYVEIAKKPQSGAKTIIS